MWDTNKSERFHSLRAREHSGTLNAEEQAELTQMIQELEVEEARLLQPATEQIRADRLRIEAQNEALRALVQREERLVERLERFLADVQSEKQAINHELAHILGVGAHH